MLNRRNAVIAGAAVVLLVLGAWFARRPEPPTDMAAERAPVAVSKAEEQPRKYNVKSGIIVSKSDAIGETTSTLYFDDYGAREATYTVTEMKFGGTVIKTGGVEIRADGYLTKYDLDKKTGERWSLAQMAAPPSGNALAAIPGLGDMNAQQMSEMNMQELEPRVIAGKEAKGYAMEVGGMKVRGWTWENIALRSEVFMGEHPIVTEVTSLELGVPVPADKFVVPADVTIEDKKM